jgi:hypothetical protein
MVRFLRACALTTLAAFFLAGGAMADSAGSDPGSNYPSGDPPPACDSPISVACIDASVEVLDQARASLGQPAYALPNNFPDLTGPQQAFVLANLDRIRYGLAPMTGLTEALNSDAMGGVQSDGDPQPKASNYLAWTSNWAGGFANMPLAYEAWMYDDGPGSGNVDCTPGDPSGCWGHRHDVLYRFDGSGPLAMGVAQGTDPSGNPGYAMLLFEGDDTYHPAYVYTWAQAVAAGAGVGRAVGAGAGSGVAGGSSSSGRRHHRGGKRTPAGKGTPAGPGRPAGPGTSRHGAVPARVWIAVAVHGAQITINASLPAGSHLQCALTREGRHGSARSHYSACGPEISTANLAPGRYRLRVRGGGVVVTRHLRVH